MTAKKRVSDMTRAEYERACYDAQWKLSRGASIDPARPDYDPVVDAMTHEYEVKNRPGAELAPDAE